ncbi:hypothetical protein R1flu_001261 [Riccia fluitans]|uniref:Uncharacterized protein n=1 Tax=Riccia fluitans TaxID=41844 RepID=A0ABD1Y2S8_9MARC
MSSAPSTNSPGEHLPQSSSADSSAQDVLSADILIARLEQLEVAVPRKERVEANFKMEATFFKHLVGLASKAVYSYCFEGEISLDSFKNWANIHWTRDRGLKLLLVSRLAFPASFKIDESGVFPARSGLEDRLSGAVLWEFDCDDRPMLLRHKGNIASPVYRGKDDVPASEDVLGGDVPPEGVNLNSDFADSKRASDLEMIPVAQPAAEVNQCQAEPEIVIAALDGTSSVGVSAGVLQGVDHMIQDLPTVSFPLRSSRLIHLARSRGVSNHPVLSNLLPLVRLAPADCNEVAVSRRAKRPRVLEEDIPSGDILP